MINRRDFFKVLFGAGVSVLGLPYLSHGSEGTHRNAVTKVIGIGGAGCNIVNNIISASSNRIEFGTMEFIAADTDAHHIYSCYASEKIKLGRNHIRGMYDSSTAAAQIQTNLANLGNREILTNCIKGADMVFITAGMGGGTGTGIAPVIAKIAKERGIFTAGVVIKPFYFEGEKRVAIAEEGIRELEKYTDTLEVMQMDKISRLAEKGIPLLCIFMIADYFARQNIQNIIKQQFRRI